VKPHLSLASTDMRRISKVGQQMWIEPDSLGYRMWMSEAVENGGFEFSKRARF